MTTRFLRSCTTIGVRSIPEALALYERVAVSEVVATIGKPPTFERVGTSEARLGLIESAAPAVAEPVCWYVDVDGVEDLHQRRLDATSTVTNPLTRQPWGNHDFVIADPDRNQIASGEMPAEVVT